MGGHTGRNLVVRANTSTPRHVSERYPTLQASLLYKNLFDEPGGTENRITQSKIDFSDAVSDAVTGFNVVLNAFPGNVVGAVAGFIPPQPLRRNTAPMNWYGHQLVRL